MAVNSHPEQYGQTLTWDEYAKARKVTPASATGYARGIADYMGGVPVDPQSGFAANTAGAGAETAPNPVVAGIFAGDDVA